MAARAAGTAVALRADVGRAFASGDGGPLENAPPPQAGRPGTPAPAGTSGSFATAPRAGSARDVGFDPFDPPVPPIDPADGPRIHVGLDRLLRPEIPAPLPVPGPVSVSVPTPMFDATPPPPPRPTVLAPADDAPTADGRRPDARNTRSTGRDRDATSAADPAPLLPDGPRPAPLAAVTPPPSDRRGALPGIGATSNDADTEVHIHIGRIDVTAVQEAPPPRRRAAPAPAPLSLDGYLAQRGRA